MKEEFFDYIGPVDNLGGYTRSYKLVFYKCFFENLGADYTVPAEDLTRLFKEYYVNRVRSGRKPDENVDKVIENIGESSLNAVYRLIFKNPYAAIKKHGFILQITRNGREYFALNEQLQKELAADDIQCILSIVEKKLILYFSKIDGSQKDILYIAEGPSDTERKIKKTATLSEMCNLKTDKKQDGLILSYYLSRCNDRAVRALGYRNFTDAFKNIGLLINENPNNIKNMRDEFDPYFDNGRCGWYQRELRASRQEIFDVMKQFDDKDVEKIAKSIIDRYSLQKVNEQTFPLQDLGVLIRQSKQHYDQTFTRQDVILTDEFKDAYKKYINGVKWEIEYFNTTSIITSPTSQNLYVPNQWFVIAAYAVDVYDELDKYKMYFERIADAQGEERAVYAKKLKEYPSTADRDKFFRTGENIISQKMKSISCAEESVRRLWKFTTDYSWWNGQKPVDQPDFYIPVVFNMLNLVPVDQGYVANILEAYESDMYLKYLVKSLDSFTVNMAGITYGMNIQKDDSSIAGIENTVGNSTIVNGKNVHRISISKESLEKFRGKK